MTSTVMMTASRRASSMLPTDSEISVPWVSGMEKSTPGKSCSSPGRAEETAAMVSRAWPVVPRWTLTAMAGSPSPW